MRLKKYLAILILFLVSGTVSADLTMRSRSGNIFFNTSSLTRMTIDTSGNVGIGTTSPGSELTIQSASPQINLSDTTFGVSHVINGADAGMALIADASNARASSTMQFQMDGTDAASIAMVIDSDKEVGIGTTTPYNLLTIDGGSSSVRGLTIDYDGSGSYYANYSATMINMHRTPNSAVDFTIDTTGSYDANGGDILLMPHRNVGIGTIKPGHTLEVNGTLLVNGSDSTAFGLFANGSAVGIGTTNPSAPLDIVSASASLLEFNGQHASAGYITFAEGGVVRGYLGYGDSGNILTGVDANSMALRSEDTLHFGYGGDNIGMTINGSTGNVGIGETSPTKTLEVYDSTRHTKIADNNATLFVRGTWTDGDVTSLAIGNNVQIPIAKIAVEKTSSGSEIHFLTSNNYNTGITRNAMTIEHTGEVGIGTTNPDQNLEIEGTHAYLHLDGTSNAIIYMDKGGGTDKSEIDFRSGTTTNKIIGLIDSSFGTGDEFFIGQTSGGNSAEFVIDNSGNVGIGTTAPNQLLELYWAGETNTGLKLGNANHYWNITSDNALSGDGDSTFKISSDQSGTAFVIMRPSGNVGIGTETPGKLLHVEEGNVIFNATGAPQGFYFNGSRLGIGTTTPEDYLHLSHTVGGGIKIENNVPQIHLKDANNANEFWTIKGYGQTGFQIISSDDDGTNANVRIQIPHNVNKSLNISNVLFVNASSENVGIGTSSPSGKLDVRGETSLNALRVRQFGTGPIAQFLDDNTERVTILTSGYVGIGTETPTHSLHIHRAQGALTGINVSNPTGDGANIGAGFTLNAQSYISEWLLEGSTGHTYFSIPSGKGFIIRPTGAAVNSHNFYESGAAILNVYQNAVYVEEGGNVGIGTSSPEYKLQISNTTGSGMALNVSNILFVNASAGRVDVSGTDRLMILESEFSGSGNDANVGVEFRMADEDAIAYIDFAQGSTDIATPDYQARIMVNGNSSTGADNYSMVFYTKKEDGGGEVLRLTGDGNVGIGASAPFNKLHVRESAVTDADSHADDILVIERTNGDANLNIIVDDDEQSHIVFSDTTRGRAGIGYDHNTDDLYLKYTGWSTGLLIDSSGNVGIGTTTPNTKLVVVGGVNITGGNECSDDNSDNVACTGFVDYAELFPSSEDVEPGDVVTLDEETNELSLRKSSQSYDSKVIGIVSTNPAMIIEGSQLYFMEANYEHQERKPAVAIGGRVPVKVSTENGAIEKGDLLTTSSTKGHAMKFTLLKFTGEETTQELAAKLNENEARRNSVLGKALESSDKKQGKIMALITLQ